MLAISYSLTDTKPYPKKVNKLIIVNNTLSCNKERNSKFFFKEIILLSIKSNHNFISYCKSSITF